MARLVSFTESIIVPVSLIIMKLLDSGKHANWIWSASLAKIRQCVLMLNGRLTYIQIKKKNDCEKLILKNAIDIFWLNYSTIRS